MHKYRHLLGEVLIASFFLQLFALVSPAHFFQVVIDKVLVHTQATTLDVLVIGLLTVSFFESVLGALRTYIFSHTTNRIDVELGARLFRHLMALPIGYFQKARRAGDSVARVRELENIRNFLTGSALTLVIDLFFTVVFLAVMYYYSPLLTWIVIGSFSFLYRFVGGRDAGLPSAAGWRSSIAAPKTRHFLVESPDWRRDPQGDGGSSRKCSGGGKSNSPDTSRASFQVLALGNWTSQAVQLISKVVTALTLYFGAYLVIDGTLTVGELVAFNMLAGRVAQPILRLAQLWQDFHQARLSIRRLGDILNTTPEPTYPAEAAPRCTGDPRRDHF